MPKTTVLISRNLAAAGERRAFEDALAELFSAAGLPVLVAPHLYHLAEDAGLWQELRRLDGRIVCLTWLYPRPAEWLLKRHGIGNAEGSPALTFDMGASGTAQECFESVVQATGLRQSDDAPGAIAEPVEPVGERWYPVVDYSRCASCRQCMQFCLFGVYEVDDAGELTVRNPDNCKPGCPACSRVCPSGAIIFPLCDSDDAIAGAPGKFMKPDAGAKAMFYARTKKPCPICGRTHEQRARVPARSHRAWGRGTGSVCSECGVPLESAAASDGTDDEPNDDLDALIDDLERLR